MKQGFTLIELLTVIAIIGILSLAVFTSLDSAREQAKDNKALEFSSRMDRTMYMKAAGIWRFEEGSGSTAKDDSFNGNDGTIVGATYSSDTYNSEISSYSLEFDGNDYVRNNDFFISNDPIFTVSAWVKKTSQMNGKGIWGIGAGGVKNQTISGYSNAGENIGIDLWGTATFYINYEYPSNRWVHIVWVKKNQLFSLDTIDIYVNGVKRTPLLVNRGSSHTPNLSNGVTMGGIQPSASYSSKALIDNVRIYTSALSAQHIKSQYLADAKRMYAQGKIDTNEYHRLVSMAQ